MDHKTAIGRCKRGEIVRSPQEQLIDPVAYLRKLMDNAGVVRFLSQRYADILAEFRKLVDTASLEMTG
jgi:hypothetical protein